MGTRTATAVWRIQPDVVRALDAQLGPPVDSYVNGSQTWLTDDGPGGIALEWRLHPVARFRAPGGLSHYDVWDEVTTQLAVGADPEALTLGDETRALASLWDGLEVFAAYGDEVEPATLAGAAGAALGIAPDVTGLVDHTRIGDEWERVGGSVSLVGLLLAELDA